MYYKNNSLLSRKWTHGLCQGCLTLSTVQQMNSLQTTVSETEYKQFTGMVTLPFGEQIFFGGGNVSDQTIEEDLMRLFKSPGGMTHGRGISDSALTKWIHGFTYCITMCEAIESFANIHTSSSEQHKDLRPNSQARDHKDLETFLQWLKIHSMVATFFVLLPGFQMQHIAEYVNAMCHMYEIISVWILLLYSMDMKARIQQKWLSNCDEHQKLSPEI